ncbi:hypothetical protein ACFLZ0_01975 [Patescibacteria group bacterium]
MKKHNKIKKHNNWKLLHGVFGEYTSYLYIGKKKLLEVQFFYEKGKLIFRRFPYID